MGKVSGHFKKGECSFISLWPLQIPSVMHADPVMSVFSWHLQLPYPLNALQQCSEAPVCDDNNVSQRQNQLASAKLTSLHAVGGQTVSCLSMTAMLATTLDGALAQ